MSAASTATATAPASAASPARALGPRVLRFVALLAGLATLVAGFAAMRAREEAPLRLEGIELPMDHDPEPFVRELARAWHETELSVDAGASLVRVRRREVGGRLEVEEAIAAVRRARGEVPIWDRVYAFVAQESRDLRWHRRVDVALTHAKVEELSQRASIEPIAVGRDGSGGRDGTSISTSGASAALVAALQTDALVVRLPVGRLAAPAPPVRDRRTARYDQVVAAHETRYSGNGDLAGRARNIYLATRFLDGAIIDPRTELSFNDTVGERSFERGFMPAVELTREGRRTEGIGGGVCQVAATLHAAAFFAGFDIVEHHPHTRNSSYIPAGLDAAVSWGSKDVVVRNPYSYPIRVRATAERGRMRIELMGHQRAPRVEWNTHVAQRIARGTEHEIDQNLPLGAMEVLDDGEDGSILERTRTVFWPEGPVTERASLRYAVVNRLLRVGPTAIRETGSTSVTRGAVGGEPSARAEGAARAEVAEAAEAAALPEREAAPPSTDATPEGDE